MWPNWSLSAEPGPGLPGDRDDVPCAFVTYTTRTSTRRSGLARLGTILRNPGKPGFRTEILRSDGLPPSAVISFCR